MLMTYRGGTGDHYDWHIDVGEGKSGTRHVIVGWVHGPSFR